MPTRETARGGAAGANGRQPVSFAELRSQLGRPNDINAAHRQRLLDLARRLAEVRALPGGYARVDFSEHAAVALGRDPATV